jgi:cellobiose phosphorylase
LALARGDAPLAELCRSEAAALARHIEQNGWDGAWYRRAYNDDGVPIGSAESEECQIDSLPQSWAELARVGEPARRRQALDSALTRLVHREEKVIQLFDPPFDRTALDPGYIKGYIPGIRENGGQYTHAAVWLAMACAAAGREATAWELFEIINPINHARDAAGVDTYKAEPYVVAADVYWAEGHKGRGGWSWYTGSAGWMHQLVTGSLLGLRVRAGRLGLHPCVPAAWSGYAIDYTWRTSSYAIEAVRIGVGNAVETDELDGEMHPGSDIELRDDGRHHDVRVTFGGV